jgi:hypothetical protein
VERAVGPPAGKGAPGPTISIVRFLSGLDRRKIQPNGVVGAACKQGLLLLGSDDVVWRADDVAQITDLFGIESKTSKRSDFGHPVLLPTAMARPEPIGSGGGPA